MHQTNTHDELSISQLNDALEQARQGFESWRMRSIEERAKLIYRIADLLECRKNRYGVLMTKEMGKPITLARAEIDKCVWLCRHYATNAAKELAPVEIKSDASLSMVRYDPLGVILAIMPWNFPFWQVLRFAVPTLMAGNVVLLKHAPNVPECALAIHDLFLEAGAEQGVFTHLFVGVSQIEKIVHDARVQGVTLTGSVRAGRVVASYAGAACKPSVLELGGSDPFIVLDDADLKLAAAQAVRARMWNTGQTCIAAKRFLITATVFDEFLERVLVHVANLIQGDPMDESTHIGPLARSDLRDTLHQQVTQSIEMGAMCMSGGVMPKGKGYFYPPTVLTEVTPGMPVFDEETFGPVMALIRVKDFEEAIAYANNSEYGLGTSIWTRDVAKAQKQLHNIESGHVSINGIVKSDPRLPFGGTKHSGYGRELGRHGLLAFVNQKTIWIA